MAASARPDSEVLSTDGPYLETKEHIGGFWVLKAADLDEARAQGCRRLSSASVSLTEDPTEATERHGCSAKVKI